MLSRWHTDETYRTSQVAIGWTETYVKYLEYTSTVDIKHEALYRQRHRYESTLFMRSVDHNPQAGPLCKREDFRPSADVLVCLNETKAKMYFKFPLHLRTRQHNTSNPTVQQHSEWLSFNWQQHVFLFIFIFDMDRKSNVVELSTQENSQPWRVWQPEEWQDQKWWENGKDRQRQVHEQTISGQLVTGENCFELFSKVDLSSNSSCSLAHSSAMFFSNNFRVQTVTIVMNATVGVQITPHRTHACKHFLVACHTSHNSSTALGFFASLSKIIPSADHLTSECS